MGKIGVWALVLVLISLSFVYATPSAYWNTPVAAPGDNVRAIVTLDNYTSSIDFDVFESSGSPASSSPSSYTIKNREISDSSIKLYLGFNKQEDFGETNSFIYDFSVNFNNGINEGATYTSSGKYGGAYTFNGNSNISIADSSDLEPGLNNFSIELWFKQPSDTASRVLFSKVLGLFTPGFMVDIHTNSYNSSRDEMGLGLGTITGEGISSSITSRKVLDNQWHHLVFVLKRQILSTTGNYIWNYTFYQDGILTYSAYVLKVGGDVGAIENNLPLKIGGPFSIYPGFNGAIDNFIVYNRALSKDEVVAHNNSKAMKAKQEFIPSLVGSYYFTAEIDGEPGQRVQSGLLSVNQGNSILPILDNFNRADNQNLGTCSDGIHNWIEEINPNALQIKDNKFLINGTGSSPDFITLAFINSSNIENVSVTIAYKNFTNNPRFGPEKSGILLRYKNNEGYMLELVQEAPGFEKYISIFKGNVSFANDQRVSLTPQVYGAGSLKMGDNITFTASGSSLKAYLNGNEILTVIDSEYKEGGIGLYGFVSNPSFISGIYWDDFRAEALDMTGRCGNNIIETGELCDGSSLNGANCTNLGLGFISGTLRCNASCTGYNTSLCVRENIPNVVSIYPGVNFIAIPGNLINKSIANLFAENLSKIDSIYSYNGSWKFYFPSKPELSNFNNFETARGYVIIANTAFRNSLLGKTNSTLGTITLKQGWNLIGTVSREVNVSRLFGAGTIVFEYNSVYSQLSDSSLLSNNTAYWVYSASNRSVNPIP